jgi:hypothetical protein
MIRRGLVLAACLLLGHAASLAAQSTPRSGGARSGGAARAAASLVGKWEFTVNADDQVRTFTIAFQRIDGALLGSGQADFGSFTVADVTQAGSDLAFSMRFDNGGQALEIPFKGKVTGATAEGSLILAMGGSSQTIPWTAKKVP